MSNDDEVLSKDEVSRRQRQRSSNITLDSLLSEEVKKRSPEEIKKIRKKLIIGAIGGALFLIFILYAIQPAKGDIQFGICSTFLELNTPYPHTLSYTSVESGRTTVRIYYSDIGPFGDYKEQTIQCTFEPDPEMGMRLRRVEKNRRPMDANLVKEFNVALPTIGASDPYVVLPPSWRNPLLSR